MICMSCISYTLHKIEQLFNVLLSALCSPHSLYYNLCKLFYKGTIYISVSLIKKWIFSEDNAYKKWAICFIVVWEHSVMCWHYSLKKGIGWIPTAHVEMTNTQVPEDFSHILFHTLLCVGHNCDCLMFLYTWTRWFMTTYIDHSIFSYLSFHVFAFF